LQFAPWRQAIRTASPCVRLATPPAAHTIQRIIRWNCLLSFIKEMRIRWMALVKL
jgi:hypothetical protein